MSNCLDDASQQQPNALPEDAASRPHIVAVCGASCSGKTTIAEKLAAEFGDLKIISADDFFLFDQYTGDNCPTINTANRTWKDWESEAAIDWEGFVQKVRHVAEEPGCPHLIVVEGFLLMAHPQSRALFDAAVHVTLSKEECWQRRRSRAESMAHLPPGFSSSEEERNYEVLETYVLSNADHSLFLEEAAKRFPDEGNLAWLRLYFEEVIWPAASEQQVGASAFEATGRPILRVDGEEPRGREAWEQARAAEVLTFATSLPNPTRTAAAAAV
mmetsp:Transcript_44998/g.89121  ORF Transcript_44998/g.89121 Transcript_44998/m.89121 type:complete len:272 (-) Transcript_44998:83-898(-)|eukprot:CAMPEP_0172723354 /NCGR_PEP_ID=MMETSP1074-20121228/83576_1 /TAXON_ID=2916 /ORGANISM="Ceratium fusus, Strain PA161109" /LENGTH=271 /DNA_ID=CAMNT_0013549573 /DNA_START=62 /DNA_END=877 /DNA_ORIENTATION=-